MTQNTSSAVMQQRREPSDSFDYFPTPLWATRALCEWLKNGNHIDINDVILEPACGEGHMARALFEYFPRVDAYDIQAMGFSDEADYLWPGDDFEADWTITNPPFRLAQQFIEKALFSSSKGVCMLVRSSFLEGVNRHKDLYSKCPPSHILQYAERVPMLKGRVDKKASTATSYSWIIWVKPLDALPVVFDWIPPCRKRLEKEGDYE